MYLNKNKLDLKLCRKITILRRSSWEPFLKKVGVAFGFWKSMGQLPKLTKIQTQKKFWRTILFNVGFFFLCTTLAKNFPRFLTSKNRKICVLLKNGKKLENFTLFFTVEKRTHPQIKLRENNCKIWFKLLETLKKLSYQLKAPSMQRRGDNRQLVPKRFSRYLPHKLTLK